MMSLCPYEEPFVIGNVPFSASEIISVLTPYLTTDRIQKINSTITNRTYNITPVMEGLYDRGNVAAVMRSAEALGYQSLHIIETSKKFKQAKRVAQGADKWLDIHRWETTIECAEHLKNQGYRILVTHLNNSEPIGNFDFRNPTALVFGNEKDGVTEEMQSLADGCILVPMLGFAQSFNISVAAALCLYHIYQNRLNSLGSQGDLSDREKQALTAEYYLRSTPTAKRLLLRYRRDQLNSE